ncbi:MAG: acetyl-CoA C-acyltransferase [Parvibaculum sp.]
MAEFMSPRSEIWLASGLRTPFAKVDGGLSKPDIFGLSVPVVQAMLAQLGGQKPDFVTWGAVAPDLGWSNLAREICVEAGIDQTIPSFTTILACATSMVSVFAAAGMLDGRGRDLALIGGGESMSHVQVGLGHRLSNWLRHMMQARSLGQRVRMLGDLKWKDIRLDVPTVANRATGKSMGEHTEEMAKSWNIQRKDQDEIALASHQKTVDGWNRGFFDSLVIPVAGVARDLIPRTDTTLEKLGHLQPSFDRTSGKGTLTAGNSSPLTDGAAAIWVATAKGLDRLPSSLPRVRLVDWELGAVDIWHEGLLMWPAYGIPRLLARHNLTLTDIQLWEIHEAFAAQVLCHITALESPTFLRNKAGVDRDLGRFPRERMNPNGGSVAIGHPFGATGARILSQAVKELAAMPRGSRAIVSICTDGGEGTVALLEAA